MSVKSIATRSGSFTSRVDIRGEVVHEVILGNPGEALLVDLQVREGRGRGALREQPADRLALIQPERRDVDQADDVGRVRPQGGDDLPAVGVAGHDGRPVLAVQYLAQPNSPPEWRNSRQPAFPGVAPLDFSNFRPAVHCLWGVNFTVRRMRGMLASRAASRGDPACRAAAASCFVVVLRYDAEIDSQR
jgi:hypothetical protein